MTLQELLSIVSGTCLQHNSIHQFGYGDEYQIGTGKGEVYPYAFLETPYQINYDLDSSRKTYQFGLIICTGISNDDNPNTHEYISQAETIANAIIYRLKKIFKATGASSLVAPSGASLKEFSDESGNGVRYDLTVRTAFELCNYEDQFCS